MVESYAPESKTLIPCRQWWSEKGRKMIVDKYDSSHGRLRISNGMVASVTINRPRRGERNWRIFWKVNHATSEAQGSIIASEECIRAAFKAGGVPFHPRYAASAILTTFEGEMAMEEVFIRQDMFLNIPGPGCGYQGCPSVSIYIDSDIWTAVNMILLL